MSSSARVAPSGSVRRRKLATPAWALTRTRLWARTSWSSRAIRRRSSVTASRVRSSRSRSRRSRRSRRAATTVPAPVARHTRLTIMRSVTSSSRVPVRTLVTSSTALDTPAAPHATGRGARTARVHVATIVAIGTGCSAPMAIPSVRTTGGTGTTTSCTTETTTVAATVASGHRVRPSRGSQPRTVSTRSGGSGHAYPAPLNMTAVSIHGRTSRVHTTCARVGRVPRPARATSSRHLSARRSWVMRQSPSRAPSVTSAFPTEGATGSVSGAPAPLAPTAPDASADPSTARRGVMRSAHAG